MDASTDAPLADAPLPDVPRPDGGESRDAGSDVAEPPRDRITADCRFYSSRRGEFIPLNGDVQFVTAFADFEVQEVTAFPDLDVELVTAFPDDCGQWREVTAFPDFTVQRVTAFSDFEIRYVTAFPGLP